MSRADTLVEIGSAIGNRDAYEDVAVRLEEILTDKVLLKLDNDSRRSLRFLFMYCKDAANENEAARAELERDDPELPFPEKST